MRVVDLFCGPGGLSEGFRMAGHDIVFGLDINKDACLTFSKNHPSATVMAVDILQFDFNIIPEFDILVGGPPCVNFSHSKGSRRNILEGLLLVHHFLKFVYERKPLYWIMENVPTITKYLPREIPLNWIGVQRDGYLDIPNKSELNSADFGVPQTRKRYLVGKYPLPIKTHSSIQSNTTKKWITLGDTIASLSVDKEQPGSLLKDINYNFKISPEFITDNVADTFFEKDELERIKRAKLEHPYMGKMAFPDCMNKPARTVVATQLGRETLVIKDANSPTGYRRATVRECATLQSFPVTYQFWSKSISSKYKMAGDAVPPLVAFNIANKIPHSLKEPESFSVILRDTCAELSPPASRTPKKQKQSYPASRKFSRMIPGKEIRGCRVELDNLNNTFTDNTVLWNCRLHTGEGKSSKKDRVFNCEESIHVLSGLIFIMPTSGKLLIERFIEELQVKLNTMSIGGYELQLSWTQKIKTEFGPEELSDIISEIIDSHFPLSTFGNKKVPATSSYSIIPQKGILVRLAAGLVATSYLCYKLNHAPSSQGIDFNYLANIFQSIFSKNSSNMLGLLAS